MTSLRQTSSVTKSVPLMHGADKQPYAIVVLVAVQSFCALFFMYDIVIDFGALRTGSGEAVHLSIETLATLAICAAIVFEVRYLKWLSQRKARLERSVSLAKAAVNDVIEAKFLDWGLTPAEKDIANFIVKGLGISDIAALRGSAEGTVKSHLNAIYRKADVAGRGELLGDILDELV